jgi:hypothetical protein
MKQFVKDLWSVLVERHKIHKALRVLNKQEWSIEFLTALLIRASRISHQQLEMIIVNGPMQLIIRSQEAESRPTALIDDDIFNHLDDEAKIKAFMEKVRER